MAFIDKLGQVANKMGEVAGKVGEVAGETFDYSKAKGKIILERGKIKDVKEAIGEYVYSAMKETGTVDMVRIKAFYAEIEEHQAEIDRLNAEAGKNGEELSEAFSDKEEE